MRSLVPPLSPRHALRICEAPRPGVGVSPPCVVVAKATARRRSLKGPRGRNRGGLTATPISFGFPQLSLRAHGVTEAILPHLQGAHCHAPLPPFHDMERGGAVVGDGIGVAARSSRFCDFR